MKHVNKTCVDAGTVNCPCPLAETGDCLVCSRLSGSDKCDCSWCGLCIYNEFIQNDERVRNKREVSEMPIVSRRCYGSDLVIIEVKAEKRLVLEGMKAGSFMFLNGTTDPFFQVPVSIMRTDVKRGTMTFAVKVVSAKTKAVVKAEEKLFARGVYRNGLLGGGLETLPLGKPFSKGAKGASSGERWLFLTKGVGFAPAVNLIDNLPADVYADMVIDTEKITEEIISDTLSVCGAVKEGRVKMDIMPLSRLLDPEDVVHDRYAAAAKNYGKVFILASDYYIRTLASELNVADDKLIYANNFHMCCGEGICGACCHIDENGNVSKMCKCRQTGIKNML